MRYTTRNVAPSEYWKAARQPRGSDETGVIVLRCTGIGPNILDSRISETWPPLSEDSHHPLMATKPFPFRCLLPEQRIGFQLVCLPAPGWRPSAISRRPSRSTPESAGGAANRSSRPVRLREYADRESFPSGGQQVQTETTRIRSRVSNLPDACSSSRLANLGKSIAHAMRASSSLLFQETQARISAGPRLRGHLWAYKPPGLPDSSWSHICRMSVTGITYRAIGERRLYSGVEFRRAKNWNHRRNPPISRRLV